MIWLTKVWGWFKFGWPLISEYIEHGFDADGMSRKDWHHAVDVWCDTRGLPKDP